MLVTSEQQPQWTRNLSRLHTPTLHSHPVYRWYRESIFYIIRKRAHSEWCCNIISRSPLNNFHGVPETGTSSSGNYIYCIKKSMWHTLFFPVLCTPCVHKSVQKKRERMGWLGDENVRSQMRLVFFQEGCFFFIFFFWKKKCSFIHHTFCMMENQGEKKNTNWNKMAFFYGEIFFWVIFRLRQRIPSKL